MIRYSNFQYQLRIVLYHLHVLCIAPRIQAHPASVSTFQSDDNQTLCCDIPPEWKDYIRPLDCQQVYTVDHLKKEAKLEHTR